ncbi:MAG: DUF3107 domain-containing protein [Actinobacteria bacterium]|nr:DUF3107 domain-containing protein [Actinomycetota bacterium]
MVEVRIVVSNVGREVTLDMADDELEATKTKVEAALSGAVDVLWLSDKKGRQVGVSSAKIAFIEIGSTDKDRRMGFGS